MPQQLISRSGGFLVRWKAQSTRKENERVRTSLLKTIKRHGTKGLEELRSKLKMGIYKDVVKSVEAERSANASASPAAAGALTQASLAMLLTRTCTCNSLYEHSASCVMHV